VELAAELEASLRDLASATSVEVRENGGRVAVFAALSWEIRGAAQKPLLHLWSEQHNFTRRVLAITDQSDQRLALAVERFGRTRPDRLEFVRIEFDRSARDVSREESCARLGRILAEQFPDESLESLTISPDLEHSLSGNYARGLLRSGSAHWAVLGVLHGDSPESAENCVTFGLLWLDRAQQSCRRGFIAGLRLIVPKGACRALAHHVQALNPRLHLEVYELDPLRETLERVDLGSAGNLETWLVPHREAQSLLDRAKAALDPIVAMAPNGVTVHPAVQSRQVWLRFRGLAFARWDDGKVFFGSGDPREKLSSASRPGLQRLMSELETHRHPLASDTRQALYRLQPERWLESIVRKDVTRIDAALDARFVYAQVFANSCGERGILDVLTVTRSGRLAILELKAAEHIHLPLQAADYWLRIRRHLQQGDFPRYGYFTGIELQPALPLVYLVAPALRFHPATDVLLRYLSSEMEVVRVGFAESWRRGLRVVMRQ
jgi:hypothetical protein